MKKVTPKSVGVKLNKKWCFKGQEEVISEEEYNNNKDLLVVLEDIKETNERIIEIVIEDESIDLEELKKDLEEFVENYKKETPSVVNNEGGEDNTGDNSGDNTGDNDDEELKQLKEKAKELGIKATHNMKKETLIAKIEEVEAGENPNPKGE